MSMKRTIQMVAAALLILLGGAAAQAAETNDAVFRFVQISDTHFGSLDFFARTRKVVEAINRLPFPIEFVAVTGDITMERLDDGVTFTNGLNILKGLKAPFHLLPGNHDILAKKLKETSQIYTNVAGGFLTRAEYKGVECLFMFVEPLADSFTVEGYDPLKQLEQRLKDAGDKPVLLFLHTPPVEDFYNNEVHPGWPKPAADAFGKRVNDYHVRAIIAGHFHRDEMHKIGTVPLYVCPPIATYWGRPTTFRIFECRKGEIVSYRTQYLE